MLDRSRPEGRPHKRANNPVGSIVFRIHEHHFQVKKTFREHFGRNACACGKRCAKSVVCRRKIGTGPSPGYNADMLIDTHCHLTYDGLRENQQEVVNRAVAAGVDRMITIGTHPADHILARQASQADPHVFLALGFHPHHAAEITPADVSELESSVKTASKLVAVGECGLDYHGHSSAVNVQKAIFRSQLELAQRLGKPVILHVRDAHDDALEIMADFGSVKRVVHCFTGTAREAECWIELGAYLGFTGIVTYKNAPFVREAARIVPEDRFVVETDSPYLSPQPVRKFKINEPAHVVHVADQIARERNCSISDIHRISTANAVRLFGPSLIAD